MIYTPKTLLLALATTALLSSSFTMAQLPPFGAPLNINAQQIGDGVQLFGGLADTLIGAVGTINGGGQGSSSPGITNALQGVVGGLTSLSQPQAPQPPPGAPSIPQGLNTNNQAGIPQLPPGAPQGINQPALPQGINFAQPGVNGAGITQPTLPQGINFAQPGVNGLPQPIAVNQALPPQAVGGLTNDAVSGPGFAQPGIPQNVFAYNSPQHPHQHIRTFQVSTTANRATNGNVITVTPTFGGLNSANTLPTNNIAIDPAINGTPRFGVNPILPGQNGAVPTITPFPQNDAPIIDSLGGNNPQIRPISSVTTTRSQPTNTGIVPPHLVDPINTATTESQPTNTEIIPSHLVDPINTIGSTRSQPTNTGIVPPHLRTPIDTSSTTHINTANTEINPSHLVDPINTATTGSQPTNTGIVPPHLRTAIDTSSTSNINTANGIPNINTNTVFNPNTNALFTTGGIATNGAILPRF